MQPHWFGRARQMGFGDIHVKIDPHTGLQAIVAIHSTRLGPALGGCRCVPYRCFEDAVVDALRLAQGMSYKAALAGLPLGGGKSVLLHPGEITDRVAYFRAFGAFVEELGGRYITAVDSGTSVADMDAVATATSHVASTSAGAATGDPSPYTARGVLRAIEAAVKHRLQRDHLEGLHVAIQGVGQVGYFLAEQLHRRGVTLTVCDIHDEPLRRVRERFGARVVAPEEIFRVECDLFAPCALGAVLTPESVSALRTNLIAGAANNQLADPHIAGLLQQRGILYAPDYVANAGGLIQIALKQIEKRDDHAVDAKIDEIYDTLSTIFETAEKQHQSPAEVADQMARTRIAAPEVEK